MSLIDIIDRIQDDGTIKEKPQINTNVDNINGQQAISLYKGDCLDVLRSLKDKSVDLIVTDPPYDVQITGGSGTVNSIKHLDSSLQELAESNIENGYDIETYNTEFVRVMKDINIYVWCNKKQIVPYINFYVNQLGCAFEILTWHKINALPTYSNKYLTDTEYCLYFHKGKGKCFPNSYEDAQTFYIAPINQTDKKLYKHPTIKPLDFTAKLIRNSSNEGDVVLDPFMGSGTTGIACKGLKRRFIGIEINDKWFDIAKERMEL